MDNTFSDLVKTTIENEQLKQKQEAKLSKKRLDLKNIDFKLIRSKVRKNFFVGFGFGLMLAALAIWFFQPLTKEEEMIIEEKRVSDMRNSEIIEAAKGLGMIFEEELKITQSQEN